jgi:glutamate-ammonia-ligase adenylyltransferase
MAFIDHDGALAPAPRYPSAETAHRQHFGGLPLLSAVAPGLAAVAVARPYWLDRLHGDLAAMLDDDFAHVLHAIAVTAASRDARLAGTYRCYRDHKSLAGIAFLLGKLPIARAGEVHARLADHVLRSVVGLCEAEFTAMHGRVRGGRHALVALGKLGSHELTAGSDLDLMLLYDFDADEPVSEGPQPLTGCQYYGRLAQRLIAALTCNYGEGKLFDVDFRLRPWGSKGPIATHLETLRGYFATEAWTFEAMALTRARVVTGSAALAAEVEAEIRDAIRTTAARHAVRRDVATMRKLVQREKATRRVWDIKCVAGGMMDIDFIVHGLTLEHIRAFDGRALNDTYATIATLADADVLAAADARTLADALGLYQAATQLLRIAAVGDPPRVPGELASILAQTTGSADIAALEARLRAAQREVRRIFEATIGSGRSRPCAQQRAA